MKIIYQVLTVFVCPIHVGVRVRGHPEERQRPEVRQQRRVGRRRIQQRRRCSHRFQAGRLYEKTGCKIWFNGDQK
jgi:hypothetical protein